MLMITPDTLYGHTGAVLSSLIIVTCFVGLTLHSDVFSGIPRKGFFLYYTNLSNLLVLFYFSTLSPILYRYATFSVLIPYADFFITASIMLTNVVFHFMIFPGVLSAIRGITFNRADRMLAVNNLLVHYAVPLLVLTYYLLCAPGKNRLSLFAAPLWLAFPLGYIAAIFLRARRKQQSGAEEALYPYPFLDVGFLGKKRVAMTCSLLFVFCALLSVAAACIMRGCYAFFGGGKALFLVG